MTIPDPLASKSEPDLTADTEEVSYESTFPIVGIGASAGGLEAYTQLLKLLPDDTGMAYVLIQHLDPHHETHLGDLLSRVSRMPIQLATQDLAVRPNHVYIIPSNTSMIICKGLLHLTPREDAASPYLPIDHFFRSLADEHKKCSIGVVLSGTGTDGTQGLEAIKEVGGITFAQDHTTAKFPGMPENAIQTGCVDFILSPGAIAEKLIWIGLHSYMTFAEDGQVTTEENHYKKIFSLLRSTAGVDFTAYRDTTIKRRILRRMVIHANESLADYISFMEQNPAEIEALYHDLLINVTSFFREPETFEALKVNVFPELLKAKESAPLIRIWVPGCSTGQEVYSLAIVLLEFLSDKLVHPTIQIFATDLSEGRVLQKAREGLYPKSIEAEVTPERLQRFFTKECDNYRINKSIREMCVFAKHNVASDPPFSRMDLISCRNLLIYLALPLQRRVIPTFHYALNPSGFLLLGASETIGVFTDLFGVVDRLMRIYYKKVAVIQEYPHFTAKGFPRKEKNIYNIPANVSPGDWQREADRIVLATYAPVGVLVNNNLDILQFRGKTSPYLESPPGEPSHNLLRMAREGLFPALLNAIDDCRKQNASVRRKGMRIKKDEQIQEIDIQVLPVKLPDCGEICFLVLFEKSSVPEKPALPDEKDLLKSNEATQLYQELTAIHEYVQYIIEQKDIINEELRTTNEEFLSSNEELQSTNEELESAKEELQSLNEELTTTNEQLNQRNKELSHLNEKLQDSCDYAEAIVKTVSEPLIVLDTDLRVQRANPAFYSVFRVTPEMTENRLLYELGNRQWDIPELRCKLEDILLRQTTLIDFEVRWIFETIGYKIMLLKALTIVRHNNEPSLILLAIEDISERKWLQDELQKSSQKLAETNQRKDEFLATLAHELRNPLAPLCNALKILQLPATSPEIALQAYEIVEHQLTHMLRLVDDLLDVSRITSGKIELRMERVALAEIVRYAVQTSQPLIDEARQKLTVTLPEESLWLEADPVRMVQVLGNLLNNASKYSENDGHIQLSAERKDKDTVLIHIKDNGIGISPDILTNIFDMFFQANTSIDGVQGGMGIGLTLVKNIVELHNGSVSAASLGIGHGVEFTICLPLTSAPDNVKSASSQKNDPFPVKKGSGMRILVVDDNKDIAKALGWMMEIIFGHEVLLAYDGASAIATARSFLPDLVLLDIGMPEMNGYEVCQLLRQEPLFKHTMIVAQTGWGQAKHHKRSKEAGFDYHLAKPVTVEALQNVLDSLTLQKNIRLLHKEE